MLSRGVLRGQRRSWLVAVGLLVASLALHLLHAADIITLVVCAAVLTLLIVQRERFRAQTERATIVTAFVILAVGGVIATLGGFVAVEVAGHVHHHPLPSWPDVLLGSAERLVGVEWVVFPTTIDRYASVSLLAVGISLIVVALYPAHQAGGRPPPVVGARGHGPARRRAQGARHRAAARDRHARLLRAARRQAVVLPPRLTRRLRRLRRSVPGLARPDRAVLRARPRLGLVPPLRRPQRVGPRRHGRGRGMAPDVPGLGHALPLHRRRGRGRPPRVLAAGRQDEGAAPGGQPRRPLRLHRPLPRPGPARSRPTRHAWPSSWPRAAAASRSAASP